MTPRRDPSGLFDVRGRTALVTGGTSGIGAMITSGLLDAGARVLVAGRKAEGLTAAEEAGATALPADLSSPEGCERLVAEVGEHCDRLDVLVNNAGATWGAPLEEFPASGWDRVLGLNLHAPFALTQGLLPLLTRDASADDPARVIMIGSIDGIRVPATTAYSYTASKAGLHQLTRHLARDLGPRHVTVNAVAPGPFESRMMRRTLEDRRTEIEASSPLGRIGRADDIVGVTLFLASRAGSYLTGAVIPVDGGISTTR